MDYFVEIKGEVRQYIQDFLKLIENQHNARVKAIRTDNGPEFAMPQFYASKGIVHQTSTQCGESTSFPIKITKAILVLCHSTCYLHNK